ncbi:nicotinate (nicotinamide) nucleotide adenylyltransferase [Viscerimonas tarda]
MNIGIFSGSFNPVHTGHLILANFVTGFTDIDEVWFLVSPQNPLKEKTDMLAEAIRYEMVKLAVEDYPKMKASDFEFSLPRPSYTINTLSSLKQKFPGHVFSLIIGGDNWANFTNWKDYKEIIRNYKVYVYPRLDSKLIINGSLKECVEALDSPIIEISSTFIRESIRDGKDIKAFLPAKVYDYIVKNGLYQL